ncbi:MAG: PfkB family carbohydrate kinase [Gammaproteobacteria bacterium]|jgi:ketohexokinase
MAARILAIGNATLDIIHTVASYPCENDEVRCNERIVRRGGNAANTLEVLGQLGHVCSWAGVLADTADGHFLRGKLEVCGIDTATCRMADSGGAPVSTIILNESTGSRTIVHHRDLPEFTCTDFMSIELQDFDWLHFEGRNIDELRHMLQWCRENRPSIPCSLEVEKPRPGMKRLFALAGVLLFSRDYARHYGYESPEKLLRAVHNRYPDADLFCTWGERGAAALNRQGQEFHQTAMIPDRVIDTLGAGDTFNAAIIHGCLGGLETGVLLEQACRLAGRKCAQTGFTGLSDEDLFAP